MRTVASYLSQAYSTDGLFAVELSGDDLDDLLFLSDVNDKVQFRLGNPGLAVERGEFWDYIDPISAGALTLSDLDQDGTDELIFGGWDPPYKIKVLRGHGFGRAMPLGDFVGAALHPVALGAADFNRDGRPDVALVSSAAAPETGGVVVLLAGDGDGTLQPPVSFSLPRGGTAVAVADA